MNTTTINLSTCFDSSKGKENLGTLLPGLILKAWVASHEAALFNVVARRIFLATVRLAHSHGERHLLLRLFRWEFDGL